MDISRTIAVIILVAVASGCSVKEDRCLCPCILTVHVSDVAGIPEGLTISVQSEDEINTEFHGRIMPGNYPGGYNIQVSRGVKYVSAITGRRECIVNDNKLTAKTGNGFDRILLHQSEVSCHGDIANDTVTLHKEFAEIAIELIDESNCQLGCSLSASCNYSGIDLISSNPVKSQLITEIMSDRTADDKMLFRPVQAIDTTGRSNRIFRFICSRQADYDMTVVLTANDDSIIDTIPVGKMLMKAGYSWETADLQDVFIRIDKANIGVSVSISDWQTGEKHEFIF